MRISWVRLVLCCLTHIDCQAKICVTMGDKVMGKLKTKRKYQSCSPIFNEALTCCIDPNQARTIMVNVAIFNDSKQATRKELGQVTLCSRSSGEEYRHWNDVMATPGKHIAEWHGLRWERTVIAEQGIYITGSPYNFHSTQFLWIILPEIFLCTCFFLSNCYFLHGVGWANYCSCT